MGHDLTTLHIKDLEYKGHPMAWPIYVSHSLQTVIDGATGS